MSRSKKAPKDKNAPKKNQSSYFHFANKNRARIREAHPDKKITEISKVIGAEWKALTAEQKKPFEESAKQDKERYTISFAEYKQTDDYKKHQQALEQWKESKSETDKSLKRGGIKGLKKPKKPKQPETMPKRPQSSYFVFNNERRPELRKKFPTKKITELAPIISKEWKAITAENKKVYEKKAAELKEAYKKRMNEYEKTDEYKEYQDTLVEYRKELKSFNKALKSGVETNDAPSKKKKRAHESSSDESSSGSGSDSSSGSGSDSSSESSSD